MLRFLETVPSPCNKDCTLVADQALCRGCLRSMAEIMDWPFMTARDQRSLLATLVTRRQNRAAGGTGNLSPG